MRRAAARAGLQILAAALALGGGLSCQLIVSVGGLTDGQCPSGRKPCNGVCVSNTSTTYGCGSADCTPCILPNAADTICDRNNACAASLCVTGYKTCLNDPAPCMTDTAHDPSNCGACSVHCQPPANGIAGCGGGQCAVVSCNKGREDCNQVYDDGCETDLDGDRANCGACGHACAPGQNCASGVCRPADAAAD